MRLPPSAAAVTVAAVALCACGSPDRPVARLSSADAPTLEVPHPGRDRLEVTWTPTEAIEGDPHVFVHLIDRPGNVLRTFDRPFPGTWTPGADVEGAVEVWQSGLAPPLEPGTYELTVGLYDPASGRRWPLSTSGREVDRAEYAVARVEVPPAADPAPRIAFGSAWLPAEPTGDRQLFAVRWLEAGEGALELEGLAGPTVLAMTVRIPRLEDRGFRLLLDDADAEAPTVEITSDCAAESAVLEGFGRHEAELSLATNRTDDPASAGACTVRFRPDFVFLEEKTFARRTLFVEKIVLDEGLPPTE